MGLITVEMAEAVVAASARPELSLTVLYDERCPLCRRLRNWLAGQATLMPVRFLAADSPDAHSRFPDLDHERSTGVLTVVTSDGVIYEGERAWLVCAWALPAWRPVVEQMGSGLRLRAVRLATRAVDGYRHRLIARSGCESCDLSAPVPAREGR